MTDAATDAARGRPVQIGAITLWVDEAGPVDGVPVVLVARADAPFFRWPRSFVDLLVECGFRVVRFDHRDCGRSTVLPADSGYRLSDLANDLVGLLNALDIDVAHLIGHAMGGSVVQAVALSQPRRVGSMVLLNSTPGAADPRLPGPDEEFVDKMTNRLLAGPRSGRDGSVDWLVELDTILSAASTAHDLDALRDLAVAEVETGWRPVSGHGLAVFESPSHLDRLSSVLAPTLVVHGTADQVLGVEHSVALANGIPGSAWLELDGVGHVVLAEEFVALAPAIEAHVRASL